MTASMAVLVEGRRLGRWGLGREGRDVVAVADVVVAVVEDMWH